MAEGLENILTLCPVCKQKHTLKTHKNKVYCEKCGYLTAIDNRYGFDTDFKFKNLKEWYRWQKDLLEQENQKVRLEYLAEYQKLQADGFSHLTENMTAAEFEALREQTAATEKAIAARSKANEAFDKAFAIQKGKGTLKEKNQLINAVVKERAAEKDWTGTKFEIKDTDDAAEIARKKKAQENAVKAEMAVNAAMNALANLAQQLNAQTDKIGAKQAPIDTRLQGSRVNDKILGSYWKQLARDMNKIGAVNPYFTQDDFANNIEALVNKGISFDIKQRAFLMTIQEKIANTFDVADGTLLRLVRIQQQDTTAGRLGMESALNSFLNSMYETSEYLSDVASSVRSSLGEMQALMEGAAATELEFQVQKWMGSLYSVGMSQDAVQSIAQTFGQIASGDVGGLTGNGTGNLLIMAANEAGMSIADILQDGLNADETNTLMQAMVNYLAEIAETSSDSRVVQQQLANVFGVKASDLRAATNLASSLKDVSKQDLTYSGMLGQLNKMANSMLLRTSTGEMLTNVWDNVQYTMATQMANDPILYLLPRVATLLEDYAGGIDLPFLNVMGFGVDLNTSVAQLMNVAAMSGSILGALGPMISGLASAASGSVMLNLAGINTSGKAPVIARGSAQPLQHLSGASLSESGYVGNASGDDVKNATLQDAEDSKKKQMVEAKDEENVEDTATKADIAVVNIYNLLEEVAHGSQSLRVRIIGPNGGGLNIGSGGGHSVIGDSSSAGSTGAMGGVSLANKVNEGNDNGNWVLAF
jgi:ribosomal protein S27AE